MKYKLLILLFALSFSAFAQQSKYGIVLGSNLSRNSHQAMNGFTYYENSHQYIWGLPMIGGYLNYSPRKWLGIDASFLYNPQGTKYMYYESGNNQSGWGSAMKYQTDKLHYLSLPVTIELFPNWRFHPLGGLEASYLLNKTGYETDPAMKTSKFDIAYLYGIGISIWNLKIDLTCSKAITPWRKYNFYIEGQGIAYHNESFRLNVKVPLYLNKTKHEKN